MKRIKECINCKYAIKCPKLKDLMLKLDLETRGVFIDNNQNPLEFINNTKKDEE